MAPLTPNEQGIRGGFVSANARDDRIVEVIARFVCAEVGVQYPSGLIDVQARELLDWMRMHGVRVEPTS